MPSVIMMMINEAVAGDDYYYGVVVVVMMATVMMDNAAIGEMRLKTKLGLEEVQEDCRVMTLQMMLAYDCGSDSIK